MNPLAKILRLTSLALAVAATPAMAGSWLFQQGGYDDGGVLNGSFTGVDANGNGWLSSFEGEITDFQAAFTGSVAVGPANFDQSHLQGLIYWLDGGTLGDDPDQPAEGLSASNGSFELAAGLGAAGLPGAIVADLDTGAFSSTELPLTVTAVPEPASALLLAAGVAALLSRRRLATIGRAPVPHQDQ